MKNLLLTLILAFAIAISYGQNTPKQICTNSVQQTESGNLLMVINTVYVNQDSINLTYNASCITNTHAAHPTITIQNLPYQIFIDEDGFFFVITEKRDLETGRYMRRYFSMSKALIDQLKLTDTKK